MEGAKAALLRDFEKLMASLDAKTPAHDFVEVESARFIGSDGRFPTSLNMATVDGVALRTLIDSASLVSYRRPTPILTPEEKHEMMLAAESVTAQNRLEEKHRGLAEQEYETKMYQEKNRAANEEVSERYRWNHRDEKLPGHKTQFAAQSHNQVCLRDAFDRPNTATNTSAMFRAHAEGSEDEEI